MIGRRALLSVAAMAAWSAGCSTERSAGPVRLGSAGVGGMFHDFARLFADVAVAAGTVRIEPVVTNGTADNLALLAGGEIDAALAMADSVRVPDPEVCAIGRLYESYLQLAVRTESPIRSVAELRGTRVNLDVIGSGASVTGERALRAAGLNPGVDVAIGHRRLVQAYRELCAGELDAICWSGGFPTPGVDIPGRLRWLDLGGSVSVMRERFGYFYDEVTLPVQAHPGVPEVRTVGVPSLLLVSSSLSDAAVAAMTKLLLEHADGLMPRRQSVGFQFMSRRWLTGTGAVPLHPAAAAVYRQHHG